MNKTLLLYRGASTDGATHLDLILAVYDALARDLNCMADSTGMHDIEGRCKASCHALLLLGYLETWVERLREPELERSLSSFYAHLRTEIMQLQTTLDATLFRDLALQVCETRAAWQQKLRLMPSSSAATAYMDAEAGPGWSA